MLHLLAFGFGAPVEWIVIALVVLVIFGPKKLPEFARSIGKSVGELKKGIDESKESFAQAVNSTPEPAATTTTVPAVEAEKHAEAIVPAK